MSRGAQTESTRTYPVGGRLLVVDDDEAHRALTVRRLEGYGYTVMTAGNGAAALDCVEREDVDLVLLDVVMPDVDGLEVLRALRRTRTTVELPVVMATSMHGDEHVVAALELGANDFVSKNADFSVLVARIASQLRQKSTAAERILASEAPRVGRGTVIAGKYRIGDMLGSGSFGSVYRARHLGLEQQVAVKVLQPGLGLSEDALARFQREGVSACRVQHPNAVTVFDFGTTEAGMAYLVMELLEGRSLAGELEDSGRLSPVRCAEVLRPICEVLAEVHASGLVHRDIKPANIFLHQGRAGEIVKVLDFGIAKLVGENAVEEHQTTEGFVLGTPAYMAPERLGGGVYDGRVDVYSLGVLLYRMLSGQLPYQTNNLLAVARYDLREPPPSLRVLNPSVSPDVESVVLRAMSPAMEARPSARELARSFGRALARRASDVAVPRSTSETLAGPIRLPVGASTPVALAAGPPRGSALERVAAGVSAPASGPRGNESMRRLFDELCDDGGE